MWRFDRRKNQMKDVPMLPLRCICGYQGKINRLKSDLEIAERRLMELGNNLQHAITENYELRNKLGRLSGDR
jgi:hypothetical protein